MCGNTSAPAQSEISTLYNRKPGADNMDYNIFVPIFQEGFGGIVNIPYFFLKSNTFFKK